MAKLLSKSVIIKTGQTVLLRKPVLEDELEFIEKAVASQELHLPWVYAPRDGVAFLNYLQRCSADNFIGSFVCLRDSGAIAGVINISEIIRGVFQSAYLSYYALQPFSSQGYMKEGLRLMLQYSFTDLRLHRLEANIQPQNKPSLGFVQRAGFRKEGYSPRYLKIGGQWRDHERWALLADEWLAGQNK